MEGSARRIVADIKSLKIQGARNIAKAAVSAFVIESESFSGKSTDAYLSTLLVAADEIASARPTEPMLRNYLRFILHRVMGLKGEGVDVLKRTVRGLETSIYKEMDLSKQMLVDYGAQLIQDGSVYYTHCHSSTVTAIFKEAFDDGRDFSVIVSETRPRFQGVKTARELAQYGIKTTLVVDSAARLYLKGCAAVFVGADAVTASGDLVNKIGTATIAYFARHFEIPFYPAAELYKFDHLTKWGMSEPIEERDAREIYKGPMYKTLTVKNPAFDLTPAQNITAYITEKGLIPPQSILLLAK